MKALMLIDNDTHEVEFAEWPPNRLQLIDALIKNQALQSSRTTWDAGVWFSADGRDRVAHVHLRRLNRRMKVRLVPL